MKRRIPALCSNEQAASSSVKRTKVHAQRKFAQGSNNFVYTSPKIVSKSPDPSVSSTLQTPQPTNRIEKKECELNNFSSLPTVDDFLTFLCFRETEVLPERLNYLNTPQLNALPSKKKSAKSNSVSFQDPKVEDNRESNCKSSSKTKSSLKQKKNKTQLPEYTLRSRPAKNNIVRKPSHSLALKHNQRLRSKSVVKAKCSENKLQCLKNKTTALAKVIPRSPHSIKNNSPLPIKTIKARPLTRALDKKENPSLPCDNDFKRVTRRNSTIDRNESLSQHCANHAIKKVIRIRPANHVVKKVVFVASKKPAKTLKTSLPKNKCYVTDSNSDSADTPLKPVTRSTRSGSVLRESSAPSNISSRPSRRTKEAAALYMEMLGKELLCPDESFEDDDNISVESFPELPNTEELNRREKEIKEMHLKKNNASKSTPSRKTSTPKPKPVAKVPVPEAASAPPATKALNKSVAAKEKAANVSDTDDAKNASFCTRSKQYKHDTPSHLAGGSTSTARKEQQTASSSSSVKIIRTRLKNDIVAAAAAAGANMGRRNSYNDAFDVAKHVTGFPKERGASKGRLAKNGGSGEDVETAGSNVSTAETSKKALETVASSESVTIKRLLSIGKYSGDEKSKKVPTNRAKTEDESRMKKYLDLKIPRRSSEPVNMEQLKSCSITDDAELVESFTSESSDSDEAEPLCRLQKSVRGPDKSVAEKTMPKVTHSKVANVGHTSNSSHNRSGAALSNSNSNGSATSGTSKSSNGSANANDPVIIERIPSRKNIELKSVKRSKSRTSEEAVPTSNKKIEDIVCAKNVVENKPANADQKSTIAETKSKIANHNLSVKSLKPVAAVDAHAKKLSVTSFAANHQKSVAKVKNNCAIKSAHVKNDSVVDIKAAKSKSPVNDVKIEPKKPSFHDLMTFDDSDDEFLIPPKLPKPVINKPAERVDNDHTTVSSTEDHRLQVSKKVSPALTNNEKCVSSESAAKTAAVTTAKEMISCKAIILKEENASNEKQRKPPSVFDVLNEKPAKPSISKVPKSVTNNAEFNKLPPPKRIDVGGIIDLVTPKCEILDDSCENQTFALDMYDDSTEECDKLSTTTLKQELVVTTSGNKTGSCSTNEMNSINNSSETNNSILGSRISKKCAADFKKPAPQPPKTFFSTASSCVKPKTVKEEKPPQSAVTTSPKVFSVDSKKLIFKKNSSYLTPTMSTGDIKDENGGKKSEAFSPDNENSVYAFEPDLPTTSPPFRRLKPVTPPKSICSNSIAVQVNFENDGKIECSGSGDTQVSSTTDCGDRVFYIPIQTSADTTSTLGVAVKLGTDGPNQKIIMSAKLITDSATFTPSSTSTSISSKSTCVETCCTQTEPTKVSSIENVTKKPEPTAAKKGNSEKVVTSSDVSQTIQLPCTSASSSTKINKKSSPTLPKPISQSVKIVKLNKNKKLKELEIESQKSKSRPVKPKSAKKSNPPPASDKVKAPSIPVGEILEAPTFYPSAEEFNDPLEYIDTIHSVAEKYGLCRIVPPANFRPECKVADEMRFTAYNQYVHKMLHRWGPNVKEMMAIKKYLSTQKITLTQAPLIGSMEIDLPRLYQIVQQCGGLNAVIEKERWHQVADIMKIPKLAQDRITKLDYIYCKYLLPYDVLSHDEREKLFEEIDKEWSNHLKNPNDDDIFDDVDECIVKGRTMPLSSFYRIARNTMMMCFGNAEGQEGPSTEKIEEEFWNHVSKRKSHLCVHSGSIDSGTYGYGFSMAKNSTFRKHPWNLKVLTNNSASILRSLGPVMGVTVPTLHVGMLYSACCWYRDPHGLPWIEYLHTGANKIWYGIPDEHSEQFKEAMLLLVPRYCRDKKIWLPSDTVMIPPPLLTAKNISLSRVVQHPGQFIVVFPKAFTSSISTGYLVSESVYFAHASWLNSAKQVFKDMQDSCEPCVFSLEQLLINIAEDARSSLPILNKVLPLLTDLHDTEVALRSQLKELGLNSSEKTNTDKKRKSKSAFSDEDLYECDVCRANLFVSMVENSHDQSYYCLRHAVSFLLRKPAQAKHCKILYVYTEDELQMLTEKVKCKIETKSGKKSRAK